MFCGIDDFCTIEKSDEDGMLEFVLTEGTYDLTVTYKDYLPCVIRNVNINPDETLNMENIVLSTSFWGEFNSSLQGRVANAMNDGNIAGATVKIRKGWNNKEDDYATDKKGTEISALTDVDGNFNIKLPVGSYTIEVSKAGFVTGYFNAVSIGGNDSQGQKYVLTPVLSDSEYHIVLTWGYRPRDLDSHLTYYQNGIRKMHVLFGGRHGNVDGKSVAKLDYDDTSSYGSETITVTLNAEILDGGVFCYSVHDYTNAYYGSVWTIDNQGSIYRFHDDWSLDMGDYENRKQGENCAYVKTIDEDIVREKYMLFQKILSDNHYKKDLNAIKSEMIVIDNNGMGPQKWYGYFCNWKGEQEYTLMHGIDGREYLSEDSRMKKLADWAMGLIETDIWDYNRYCDELKTEEY